MKSSRGLETDIQELSLEELSGSGRTKRCPFVYYVCGGVPAEVREQLEEASSPILHASPV